MKRVMRKTKSTNSYHHGDLRRALLDAALTSLEEKGADELSLSALARSLGVSQPAPYRHFADRDALLAAVAAEGFRLFGAALTEAAGGGSGRATLGRMCKAYITFGLARPGLYRLMFDSNLLARARVSEELQTAARLSFELLVTAIPGKQGPARRRRAFGIWTALHGMVLLQGRGLLEDSAGVVTLDDLVDELLD